MRSSNQADDGVLHPVPCHALEPDWGRKLHRGDAITISVPVEENTFALTFGSLGWLNPLTPPGASP